MRYDMECASVAAMRGALQLLAVSILACDGSQAAQMSTPMTSQPSVSARPAPGQPAPDFSAAATDDRSRALSDYKGKQTLVLAFFPKAFTGG